MQGTVNGCGEHCGNANPCSLVPNLELKLGRVTNVGGALMPHLRETARFVSELANLALAPSAPFVGDSAFAHKGGGHISAVEREPRTTPRRANWGWICRRGGACSKS